ncbi:bacterioopsin transcriptional activator [Halalkalicoccus paucihalophilus]|uniref:Bacterioopsin transcriptional activator n=1 Tax=Halalkalicoccus paucihalophilus TaxID=1008153 RepID=A0A151A9D7_9EURY|nr:GAF domain-containing protein [Halalkalicoccus paucihalophilus]KYH24170.1 bacterioopsin transcriptional activator [Halalkalicoccus paucihalophilus]
MNGSAPSLSTILEGVDQLGPPGTPLTTAEVAAKFECTDRTIYNRLDTLVEIGVLETKQVGAQGRVWWRPLNEYDSTATDESEQKTPVADSNGSTEPRARLCERGRDLAVELATTKQLQEISTRLIQKDDIDTLYEEILDAVVTIMHADFARLQLRDPDQGDLKLLADSGFDETTALWDRVDSDSNGPCSVALETAQRVIVSDAKTCEFMADTEDQETLLETGIRAIQSTPLVSRSGDVIGMLSTHWKEPHEPSERDLRSLDVLARQATDLINQQQVKEDLRKNRELVAGQKHVLEKLAKGASLDEVLTTLIDVIEAYTGGMYGTFLISQLGEERFKTVIGPNLPESYTSALEGASMSPPYLGPCGKAAHLGQTVICDDLETDTRWASEWRELALSHDLYGCYSTPIIGPDDEVLGSFGLYSTQSGDVIPDQKVREAASNIAGIAINRKRTEEALRESEESYRELFESMTEGFCVIEKIETNPDEPLDFRYVKANPAFAEQSGLDDVVGQTMREIIPEEASEWIEVYDTVVQTGDANRFERELIAEERTLELYAFPVGDKASEQVGVIFQDITERRRMEEQVRESEEKYRTLFESVDQGFCIIEMLFDEDDEPVDFRFLETNPAFEDHTGLTDAEGNRMRELEPEHEQHWFDIYGEIVETGESKRFEQEAQALKDRWYAVNAFPHGSEDSHQVAILFEDITERKQREERGRFRTKLTDTLHSISDPVEIQAEAARVIGEHLNADRANYCEVLTEDGQVMVHSEYRHGDVPPATGEHHFDDFGQHILETLQAGDSVVVDDLTTNPAFSEQQRTTYEEFDIRSLVAVPLLKKGHCTAYVVINQTTPREWTDNEIALVEETAERTWNAVERAHAEQALKQANEGLERLTTGSRDLMDASTQTITDRAAELTRTVLDVEYTALWEYDETTGEFSEHIHDTAPGTNLDISRLSEELSERVWHAFINNQTVVENDLSILENEREHDGERAVRTSPLQSYTLIPLGRHGVVCAGATHTKAFDEQMVDLTTMLGATLETAWDRASGEQQLARQNEELARLDRLNGLIREIDKALVEADSLGEIDRAVCDRLAASDQYEFVWIGERDPTTETITPREWAGVDSSYMDELTISTDETALGRNPIVAAADTYDMQVVSDIATETRFEPLREATLEQGARSCISVPLVYEESLYGVLSIYAGHPQSDERDHAVLAELGHTIAHAINAVETRETRHTDRVVELTLQCHGQTTPLCQLARKAGCTIEFEGLVYRSDGEPDVFFTTSGVSSENLIAASEQVTAITELRCLSDQAPESETLFRARVSEPTLASLIIEQDAVVRTLTIEDGTVTAIVDVSHTANVRVFIERLQDDASGLELLSRQTRTRALKTQSTFQSICKERLTAKQLAALKTAYFSGFFESPRMSTGQEVAASLDVSQPTFTAHLRAAEREVCTLLFAAQEIPANS